MLNYTAPRWPILLSMKSWFIPVYLRLLLVIFLLPLVPTLRLGLLVTQRLLQSLWFLLRVGAYWCTLTNDVDYILAQGMIMEGWSRILVLAMIPSYHT